MFPVSIWDSSMVKLLCRALVGDCSILYQPTIVGNMEQVETSFLDSYTISYEF